jgi:hypothetical protein
MAAGFVRPICAGDRRMAIQADQRPAAAGSSQAGFGPGGCEARAVSAARPLATGLQAQAGAREVAMGHIDVWAGYEVLNSTVYDYLPNFRSLFDEFLHSF